MEIISKVKKIDKLEKKILELRQQIVGKKYEFDLVTFLKYTLTPKKFKFGEKNEHFVCHLHNEIGVASSHSGEQADVYFVEIPNDVWKVLIVQKVNMKQLRKAFIKLGWYEI